MPRVEVALLRERAVARLREAGVGDEAAGIVVDHMLTAELWGRSSHGLSLRFGAVLGLAEGGAGDTPPEVVRDGGHFLLVSGRNGFGYLAGHFCAQLLIERTARRELAAVALKEARHTGMLGYYVNMAARAGVVAMAFGDCCPLMAPAGGSRALLGTNPLAFAFPAEPDPIVVDMGTSALTYGDLMAADRAGEPIPPDCALDAEGDPTRDPAAARKGALLPLGGHKGGALAVAVQLLAGALTGAPAVPPPGRDYGLPSQGTGATMRPCGISPSNTSPCRCARDWRCACPARSGTKTPAEKQGASWRSPRPWLKPSAWAAERVSMPPRAGFQV